MRKFQFHLQKVLDMKEKKREQEEWNYTKMLHQLLEEKEHLTMLINQKNILQQNMILNQIQGTLINQIHQSQDYLSYLESLIQEKTENVKKMEEALSVEQKKLQELKIEEKIWTNFRDRKWQEFVVESSRMEQKELDELVTQRTYV